MRKRGRQPFTDTEAQLILEREMAWQRYQEMLAEKVWRLQPSEDGEAKDKAAGASNVVQMLSLTGMPR